MHREKKLFIMLATIIILVINIFSFIKTDQPYSDMELKKKFLRPGVGLKRVLNGEYYTDLEQYYLDQMFFRDEIVNFKAQLEKSMRVRQRNGVIFGVENQLLPVSEITNPNDYFQIRESNINEIVKNIEKISVIANENNIDVIRIDGLEKSDVYHNYYPFSVPTSYDGNQLFREKIRTSISNFGIDTVSMDEFLLDRSINTYYYTDHHYNIHGGIIAYNVLLNSLNDLFGYDFKETISEELGIHAVDKMFSGSYSRLLGDKRMFNFEKLEVPSLITFPLYDRFEMGQLSDIPLITDTEKSTYSNFMGGDKANTVIKTNRSDLPNILYLGDSFTNLLELLSVQNFNEMHSIDMRHYKDSVYEYIINSNIDIIVLVNSSLFTDQFMERVK